LLTMMLSRLRYQWFVAVALLVVASVSPASGAGNQGGKSAEAIYSSHCARCHGSGGKGDGWQARLFTLIPGWLKMPNLADPAFMQTRQDSQLMQSIKAGGNAGMPAFALEFTEPQIKDLVAYIRTFTQVAGSRPLGRAGR